MLYERENYKIKSIKFIVKCENIIFLYNVCIEINRLDAAVNYWKNLLKLTINNIKI